MIPVFWTPSAQGDLGRIDDYVFQRDPAYAYRVGIWAIEAAQFLADWPEAGGQLASGAHKWPVKGTPYLPFYRLHEGWIEVLRVRHNRENWREEA